MLRRFLAYQMMILRDPCGIIRKLIMNSIFSEIDIKFVFFFHLHQLPSNIPFDFEREGIAFSYRSL